MFTSCAVQLTRTFICVKILKFLTVNALKAEGVKGKIKDTVRLQLYSYMLKAAADDIRLFDTSSTYIDYVRTVSLWYLRTSYSFKWK